MGWLTVQGLEKNYQGRRVLDGISFSLDRGTQLGIAGETGSSKTTLLQIIAGLLQADSGVVLLEGQPVLGPLERLIPGHPQIGYLSQHFELRNHYRVGEELDLVSPLSKKEQTDLFTICAISHLLDRKTADLSGGERQRIALARVLIKKPSLLLLDEPFSHLDPAHKRTMKQVLAQLSFTYGLTTILVSHDGADLLSWAQHIILLQNGKIVQAGKPIDLYHHPLNAYAAGLLGEFNMFDSVDEALFTSSMLGSLKNSAFPLFLRPEQFELAKNGPLGLLVHVKSAHFMGNHTLLEVYWNNKRMLVRADMGTFDPGETAFLRLKSSHNF